MKTPAGASRAAETSAVVTPLFSVEEDHLLRVRLDSMKRRATGLLGISAVVFAGARVFEGRFPWLGYVRATAEASLVGGIADWFAVTALFKHPLGIPIPHTAIIKTRKARFGQTLGRFVQRNFLSHDAILARFDSLQVGGRMARWLCQPENSRFLAEQVTAGLAGPIRVLRDEEVQHFLDRRIVSWLGSIPTGPALARILWMLTSGGRHHQLLDSGLRVLSRLVSENEEVIRDRVRAESPWWIPERIEERIQKKILRGIENTLREITANPDHPLRVRYDQAFRDLMARLQESPEMREQLETIKAELLEHPAVREFSVSLWTDVKDRIVRLAEEKDERVSAALERWLTALGNKVLAEPALLAKVESWMRDAVAYVVDRYSGEMMSLITHTVDQWDPDATSEKIELQVGRDLQFIRINGTLVGGMVGLLLHALSAFF